MRKQTTMSLSYQNVLSKEGSNSKVQHACFKPEQYLGVRVTPKGAASQLHEVLPKYWVNLSTKLQLQYSRCRL